MPLTFVDVETANFNLGSICQIGFCVYEEGREVVGRRLLVDPREEFTELHTGKHGICALDVAGAPLIADALERLHREAGGPWVSHTGFDRASIGLAVAGCGRTFPSVTWYDSARIVRRTWPQFSQRGYGLKSVADFLGYDFEHHDALEDARAAAFIVHRAMEELGIGEDGLPALLGRTVSSHQPKFAGAAPTGDGPLIGETVVITGALSAPRRVVAEELAAAGAHLDKGVTARTTILVVGELDPSRLAGKSISGKQAEALQKIAGGQAIRIVSEAQVRALFDF